MGLTWDCLYALFVKGCQTMDNKLIKWVLTWDFLHTFFVKGCQTMHKEKHTRI